MSGHLTNGRRLMFAAGTAAGLVVAGLLFWGIVYPAALLDVVQALDFTLG